MLLNKKVIIFGVLFLLFASLVSAEVCEVDRIKQVLKKILFLYYTEPDSVPLTKDEVKDMLVFYLSINDQNITVDCSAFGSRSNKPISDVVNAGNNVADKIPACADGTKYGECSKTRPAYCYAGAISNKCELCGCPTNSVCGKSQKCESTSQNISCFKDVDCGQTSFTGDYYCVNNNIVKNILNYSCMDAGTINSRCAATNGTVWLTYCNPAYNQVCVSGKNTCQATVNDSVNNSVNNAPTVSISVNPTTAAQGQFFNVTVVGTDDVGLTAIWWWATSSSDSELNKAHWYICNGARACTYSWLVSTNATGVLTLGANSRDTAYPTAGQPHQASEGAGIAYATLTVTSGSNATTQTNQTTFDTIIVKGRYVDRFTEQPIPNTGIWLVKSPSERLSTSYANSNGEFAVTISTTDITQAIGKVLFHFGNCYIGDNGIAINRYPTSGYLTDFPNYQPNAVYVWTNNFDLSRTGRYFAVTSTEVNVGDIPLWPSADFSLTSDIPVKFDISYPEDGRGAGNGNYLTSHYLSYVIPLNYNVRVQLTDNSGNIYYSSYTNLPLSNGCTPVNLNFFNRQSNWNLSTTNQTPINQTSQTCTDSDGGRNYYVKGTATGSINAYDTSTDFCSGNYVTESFCLNGGRAQESYLCPGGCSDGACIPI